jgi:hypothetical protein
MMMQKKLCKMKGCMKPVKRFGKCSAHGPKRRKCDEIGCTKVARKGRVCYAHGAPKSACKHTGCNKWSVSQSNGMCTIHYKQAKLATLFAAPAVHDIYSTESEVENDVDFEVEDDSDGDGLNASVLGQRYNLHGIRQSIRIQQKNDAELDVERDVGFEVHDGNDGDGLGLNKPILGQYNVNACCQSIRIQEKKSSGYCGKSHRILLPLHASS